MCFVVVTVVVVVVLVFLSALVRTHRGPMRK